MASKESGLCQEFFEKADEKNSGNLLQAFAAGFTFGPFQYNDFLSNDKLFQIQSDAVSYTHLGKFNNHIHRITCLSDTAHSLHVYSDDALKGEKLDGRIVY